MTKRRVGCQQKKRNSNFLLVTETIFTLSYRWLGLPHAISNLLLMHDHGTILWEVLLARGPVKHPQFGVQNVENRPWHLFAAVWWKLKQIDHRLNTALVIHSAVGEFHSSKRLHCLPCLSNVPMSQEKNIENNIPKCAPQWFLNYWVVLWLHCSKKGGQ